MHSEEKKALLALSYVPKLGIKSIRELLAQLGSARKIWNLTSKEKNALHGLNSIVSNSIGSPELWKLMEDELRYCDNNNIQVTAFNEDNYPSLLKECVDSPLVIFTRGNMNLEDGKFVSIVGTRNMTARGREFIHELVSGFRNQPVTVISGLALGVDAEAHRASIENELQTVGVLAHGVNRIFPKTNERTGLKMLNHGGLLSEFSTFHSPEPENFLRRNRIIAGLSHATVIIESGIAGGAMNTARHANNYNRDVFAVPGRTTDVSAAGCHYLIKNHLAFLLTEADDVLKYLNITPKKKNANIQRELFVELSEPERSLYEMLRQKGKMHIDNIALEMNMAVYLLMPVLLDLELKNLVEPLPGKYYELM